MTLPSSGQISLSQVDVITNANSASQISMDDTDLRFLFGVASGQISMNSGYGKPTPGSFTYSSAGGYVAGTTYSFYVPAFQNLTVDVMAGSGGGGGGSDHYPFLYCNSGSDGTDGGNSAFLTTTNVFANGGAKGIRGYCGGKSANGANGAASGGDYNNDPTYPGYNGGLGGVGSGAPGAGSPATDGSNGGKAGRARKTWTYKVTSGAPDWGSSVNVYFGNGGNGGGVTSGYCGVGAKGSNGYVTISWS